MAVARIVVVVVVAGSQVIDESANSHFCQSHSNGSAFGARRGPLCDAIELQSGQKTAQFFRSNHVTSLSVPIRFARPTHTHAHHFEYGGCRAAAYRGCLFSLRSHVIYWDMLCSIKQIKFQLYAIWMDVRHIRMAVGRKTIVSHGVSRVMHNTSEFRSMHVPGPNRSILDFTRKLFRAKTKSHPMASSAALPWKSILSNANGTCRRSGASE